MEEAQEKSAGGVALMLPGRGRPSGQRSLELAELAGAKGDFPEMFKEGAKGRP